VSYDFDRVIDRSASDSAKWGAYHGRDVLALSMADMDFQAPPEVVSAVDQRLRHGIFGYGDATESVLAAVTGALDRDYGWRVGAVNVVWFPGLVVGINIACRALTDPGEAVLTASPAYPPFLAAPGNSGRVLVDLPLVSSGGRWEWDWNALEERLASHAGSTIRLLLLCHPHNPVGRAWTRGELERLLEIVIRNDLVVCSDEIHCELILDEGRRHIPFASLCAEAAARTVTLMAPSKTYNLPGLGCAFAIVTDERLAVKLRTAMRGMVSRVNVLGLAACEAAYRDGRGWRKALLEYLRSNRDRVVACLEAIPELRVSRPEATYLAWIDSRALCAERQITDPVAFFEAAGVGLSNGAHFGAPGFMRLNFGCPRATLDLALQRIAGAIEACRP
jgi:cystathionine beta-lyase